MRPATLLIAAMGGEGGGVLTDWIVGAALRADLPVQGTSIPGVAQRTGATTYYVELWPETNAALGGRRPVFGLGPAPGDVDVVLATELVEAGRCCERGFVSPDRTTLIAATRRVFATAEKSAMGDGRFDAERVMRALREMPREAVLFDPDRLPDTARGAPLNALMLGLLAARGALPIPAECFREAIQAGVAAAANLRGFEVGLALAALPQDAPAAPAETPAGLPAMLAEAARSLPPEVLAITDLALPRLAEYQSPDYARRYLDRLRPILAADPRPGGLHRLTAEVARHLALWMAYEDVIRVAQLKTSAARFAEIRAEMRAAPGEPVQVTEFLKPGIEEIASLLPRFPGRHVLAWARRGNRAERLSFAMRLRSDRVSGFLRLRLLAGLRRWRPHSLRFAEEQAAIDAWLRRVEAAAARGELALALEITACARLLKGYGETHRRGREAFRRVMEEVADRVRPGDPAAAGLVARAREAALADPEHRRLAETLAAIVAQRAEAPLASPAAS